jgi:hypothetical protein
MKYAKWILILALALGACSERSAPAPAGASPKTLAPGGQALLPNPALPVPPSPSASDPTPAPSMKDKYPNKDAFLADLKAVNPVIAVELDGKGVSSGLGPAMPYRTNKDGSVSR